METKDAQTVARQAAAPTAPTGKVDGDAPASAQEGIRARRVDEITLRVPNPLLDKKKSPAPAPVPAAPPAAPRQADPESLHSSPTAKLKVSSLVWNEYNSLPLTPPPQPAGQTQAPSSHPGSPELPKHRRGLTIALVAVIISAGAITGALIPRGKAGSEAGLLPRSEPANPAPGTPEKGAGVPTPASATPAAPARPSKRRVSITAEPADATLALDGKVVGSHAIALDLAQDGAAHVVQATAPGYLPFKKSFTLEGDVNLRISLKKAAALPAGRPSKAKPSVPVAKPTESEPSVRPRVEPAEDFGMDLNRPAARRQMKKMDEKDPYSP